MHNTGTSTNQCKGLDQVGGAGSIAAVNGIVVVSRFKKKSIVVVSQ